ncbi:ROK family transcriptional regulator [Novosphingobium beihaiensis]|uniref:ROK family transcriptional regulator n=1 Tax=Novosphingobium beihaiensis TaxID=2930389 RepID=A0ABT0BLD2_9SPHN|nr:ROK family transcriptional regulator [Novosphingobium beihaiensis]MCJ2185875.1 ROK family transcriptional regulator [Novosphingobium beihaiensis]
MKRNNPSENRLAVLKAIGGNGPVTRSDLPELTGLAAGTISQITAEFVRRGFLVERKDKSGLSGRPRVYLEVKGEGPIVVGARMTIRRTLAVTFADLSGQIRFSAEPDLALHDTLEETAQGVAEALSRAVEESGFRKERIERFGIAMPALVDSEGGMIHFMATYDQRPFAFAAEVAKQLQAPVTIEKGTASLARAEHWFGEAQGHETFTLINVDLSLDSAMYFNGKPRVGAHGLAPELGHVKTDHGLGGEACYCGAHGCATAYASIAGIIRRAGLYAGYAYRDREIRAYRDNFAALTRQASEGDPNGVALFQCAGTHLGYLVADHINAADPGFVLIMVPDARYTELVSGTFNEALERNTMPALRKMTQVRFAPRPDNWDGLSAAALALENV